MQKKNNLSRYCLQAIFLLLVGCSSMPKKKAALEGFAVQFKEAQKTMPNLELTAKRMTAIDVSKCPEDFRQAWFDFLMAEDRVLFEVKHHRPKGLNLMQLAEGAKLGGPWGAVGAFLIQDRSEPKQITEAKDQFNEALLRLQRVLRNYW